MKRTLVYFWMLCSLINIISGCSLYAPKHVTGYTRDSVALPCYCTDGQARQNFVRWIFLTASPRINIWTYPDQVDYRYRDRVVISEGTRIFSLHLSHLSQRDEGSYRCEADGQYKDITLSVKGKFDHICPKHAKVWLPLGATKLHELSVTLQKVDLFHGIKMQNCRMSHFCAELC
ncbi:hypothetical protein GJAV_G00092800 [Gymnothorax javanicus]|nr:hypothetical protein GJAV_G00092800 [Gymnothorax javanicus]